MFVAPQARPLPAASDRIRSGAAPTPSWEPVFQAPDLSPLVLPSVSPGVADLLGAVSSGSSPGLPGSLFGGSVPMGANEPWTADSVDDPVEVIEQPAPRYPPGLAQAGVTGRVELEYVVDTLGRAEPGSLRAVTQHPPGVRGGGTRGRPG